jgi:hypothetical protein
LAAAHRDFVKTAANVALFQIGWFASILGAAGGHAFVGPVAVGLILAIHFRWLGTKREWPLLVLSGALGTLAESVLALTGLVSYRADPAPRWLCPPWITAMWVNFAMTLKHSLGWLEGRCVLALLLGALAGPLAYVAGERLGAIELARPPLALTTLGLIWGSALAFFCAAQEI